MLHLIDTHCHLESYSKNNALPALIQKASLHHVLSFINVGTTLNDWFLGQKLNALYPQTIYYTVGLHPCYVQEDWNDQLSLLPSFFADDHSPVAIGEIGLDFFHLPKDPSDAKSQKELQLLAFHKQLQFALQLNCPIVIHSRNAFHETLEVILESKVDPSKVIFHCFSESAQEMQLLMNAGMRASFTGIITYKNAQNVREAALAQGLESLILETDAPYLSPEPVRKEANEPAYTFHIAQYAANLFNTDFKTIASISTKNAKEFFGLPI